MHEHYCSSMQHNSCCDSNEANIDAADKEESADEPTT